MEDPSPERRFAIRLSVVELFLIIRHWSTQRVTNFLFIRWVIQTTCKLPQKSPLHYGGSYLHTTLPPSVIFVTEQIPSGGSFYCSIARYPKLRKSRKCHETTDVEAICILQIASKIQMSVHLLCSEDEKVLVKRLLMQIKRWVSFRDKQSWYEGIYFVAEKLLKLLPARG